MVAPETKKPRVGFVVQRAGTEVVGGAESLCLQVAQRMSKYWSTEVLTTCALDYMTWDNHFPEGIEVIGDTRIRRFPVDAPRDVDEFNRLSADILERGPDASLEEQEHWMRAQGPLSNSLLGYLKTSRDEYDAFIFFGYLYATTYFGLPLVKEAAYLAPLAHDEWPIHLSMWDEFFTLPAGYLFQTPEELQFLRRRFSLPLDGPVAGIGVDEPRSLSPDAFRANYNLREPFLLYVGRIDASKGCAEMFDWFIHRNGTCATTHKLVVIGREVQPVPFHDNIIYLGVVSDEEKLNAMAACDWMILPSRYESLSLALLETWMCGRPCLVNASSEVLAGHCRRSGGGCYFESWSECDILVAGTDDATKGQLGRQGRDYVRNNYRWRSIEEAYLTAVKVLCDHTSPHFAVAETSLSHKPAKRRRV